MRAMVSMLIDFGHAAWHSPCQLQLPKPSPSICATIASTRRGALRLALRQHAEVRDLRGREERRRAVGASRDACSAADAGGGVHRFLGGALGNEDGVRRRVRCPSAR